MRNNNEPGSSPHSLDLSDSVESLLDKNLLKRQEGVDGASRFTMLEMLREYAVGCLERSGESDVIGRSHTEYYLALGEASAPESRGPRQSAWVKRLEQEHDNMRAALRWTEANHEQVLHLRLALALWWFWIVRGHINEANRWLVGPLAEEAIETPLRARGLYAAGVVAWAQGDMGRAESYLHKSLALYRETANALGVGQALRIIANLARDRGDFAASRLYYEQSFDAIEEAQDAEAMALVLISMGENARGEGNYETARSYYERSVEISCDFESGHTVAIALFNLGLIEHHEGHEQLAKELFKRSLRLHHGLREMFCIAECLYGLGGVASAEIQTARAVRLLAAADVLFHSTGYQQNSIDRQGNDYEVSKVRGMLDQLTFERLWTEGQTMSMEQAVAYALDEAYEMIERGRD
ncbi:MAG: tetratricopeptide repeat protein [Chloroflexota bacterium]